MPSASCSGTFVLVHAQVFFLPRAPSSPSAGGWNNSNNNNNNKTELAEPPARTTFCEQTECGQLATSEVPASEVRADSDDELEQEATYAQ